ncbi:hypothetical protein [Sphingomonas rubra]|uniref:Uncharacterized protein n=1 Tax=Sphingomonas rubra TaxID=634430 RepID=A0A1I5PJ41_9SPHN|nr:hypothetical protein [Sphingomonas rubra]SFP33556.1 hypothetical protein SAMN04488241_10118 [Sphingomonas rubra]
MTGTADPVATAWAALARSAAAAECTVALVDGDAAPWWSATFAGDAVWLTLDAGMDAEAWLAALPKAELSIPDRLVADCYVERDGGRALVSLLVLDPDAS